MKGQSECDIVLEKCAKAAKDQKEVINKQNEVIEAQDKLVKEQDNQIKELEESGNTKTAFSIWTLFLFFAVIL